MKNEEYTTQEIFNEIQNDVSESMSDILARQRQQERGFKLNE